MQVKWSNVDIIRRVLTVIPGKTARRSNGKVLRIPMHRTLHAMLDQNVVQAAVDSLPDVTGAPRITSAAANPREGDVGAALALLERLDVPGLKVVAARARKLITTRK